MRNPARNLRLLALAASAIFTLAACGETTPEPETDTEVVTEGFELSECDFTSECQIADHARFFEDIYGPDGLGVMTPEESLAVATCLGDGVCGGDGFCHIPDFTLECIVLLPGVPGDACYNDSGCDDADACTTDSCVASRCVSVIDDIPESENECAFYTCDTIDGLTLNSEEAGVLCGIEDDVCNTFSECDGAGFCVENTEESECCDVATDCPLSCDTGEIRYCTEPFLESPFGLCGCTEIEAEVCYDGIDNDDDDLADCFDPDCATALNCESEASCCGLSEDPGCSDIEGMIAVCAASHDDEYCCESNWDEICVNAYALMFPELCVIPDEVCDSGIDDDFDFAVDCFDPDCFADPACAVEPPAPESACADGSDNDGDLFIDCADSDCFADPACAPPVPTEICGDGIDNDLDSEVDCFDADCDDHPFCDAEEVCDDAFDNDADGEVDCDDADCAADPACVVLPPAPESACTDGSDNDGDLLIDCADPDCALDPACAPAPPTDQLTLPPGDAVICWAVGDPVTGTRPGPSITREGPLPNIGDFAPLCFAASGAGAGNPVDYVLCSRFDSGAAPFFAGQEFVDSAECGEGGFGCGSSGYDSTDEICGIL